MNRGPHHAKTVVRWILFAVLAADIIFAGINIQLSRSVKAPGDQLKLLDFQARALRADNARVARFRAELPADEKQWDDFFTSELRPQTTGYSEVSADLGALINKSGLSYDTINFHQHAADARGVVQIDISTGVEGDYEGLVTFLTNLEKSNNFYVLDSLALASTNGGKLHLALQLRTYFRT